jgi:hypothetical protein
MSPTTAARGARALPALLALALAAGCGTTRMTDTQRTATEQMLISDAVDHAVSQLDVSALAGKSVFLDVQYLDGAVDRGYLISSLRQHLLASGCLLMEDRARAVYVVEARAGGLGTDRHSLLVGVPQMQVPSFVPGQPTAIPEIPLARKTDQNGVAKLAVFAYNRQTGKPVWQSGVVAAVSSARDVWLLGAGPFQKGTIRQGTEFAGQPLPALPALPLLSPGETIDGDDDGAGPVVTQPATWAERPLPKPALPDSGDVKALLAAGRVPTVTALIRDYLDDSRAQSGGVSIPPLPKPAPTPNAGGQAETQPLRAMSSALGFTPDG